jgi:hypothetical protein
MRFLTLVFTDFDLPLGAGHQPVLLTAPSGCAENSPACQGLTLAAILAAKTRRQTKIFGTIPVDTRSV